jgi:TolA-binding protein
VKQRALVLLLDIAWEAKDWPTVVSTARALIQKFPQGDQRAFAEYRLGEGLLQTGKTSEAIETLAKLHDTPDTAVKQAEWFPGVRLLLAEAQLQGQKYAAVEATVQKFRDEDPQSPLLYQADEILGRRFKNEARWEEARTALKRVVDSESGRRTETAAKAQLLIAETYLLEMKDSEAVAEYYKVFLNYDFPEYQAPALYQSAKCDERLMRWASAVKAYETLIQTFPEDEYAKKAQPELEAAKKRVPAESTTPSDGVTN